MATDPYPIYFPKLGIIKEKMAPFNRMKNSLYVFMRLYLLIPELVKKNKRNDTKCILKLKLSILRYESECETYSYPCISIYFLTAYEK